MSLYGPQLPPGFKPSLKDDKSSQDTSPVIGPTLPPGFRISDDTPQDDDGSDDSSPECYGPSLPPSHAIIGPALPPGFNSAERDNFIGPILPPGIGATQSDEEDSDDDLVGPRPSEAVSEDYVEDIASEIDKRSRKMKRHLEGTDAEDVEQKRESWMTELPDNLGSCIGLGPRTFKKQSADPNVDRSGWTDTPADKAKKAKGVAVVKEQSSSLRRSHKEREKDEQLSRELEKYNKHKRPMSLVEMHRKKRKETEKRKKGDKPERKEFNRDEDLKISRIDPKAAKALINNTTFLRSKFSAGTSKFL
ncbi:GPALPP motifs-containing protein 1-like [Ornithodoros turicata]|uniref:GPALPP motifs-containing protein 1-like n=1 Tax=Ornithodoros turicata TaxID=34597 RepID=UPI00313A4423